MNNNIEKLVSRSTRQKIGDQPQILALLAALKLFVMARGDFSRKRPDSTERLMNSQAADDTLALIIEELRPIREIAEADDCGESDSLVADRLGSGESPEDYLRYFGRQP